MPSTSSSSTSGTNNKRKQSSSNIASSVFKTRKAKVGKKVIKSVNDTDVSFKAASLYVAGQTIENNHVSSSSSSSLLLSSSSSFISSRGKALSELLQQLQTHPSSKARCSACKGVLDILSQKQPHSDLHPQLSHLLPALLQASNDQESKELRQLSIEALGMIMQEERLLQPFAALIVARISSALNSLDSSVRLTGVALIKLFCEQCPSLMRESQKLSSSLLLQPFVGLLAEHSAATSGKEIAIVLQSIVALLKVCANANGKSTNHTTTATTHNSTTTELSVDLHYIAGNRSRNAILLSPRPKRRNVPPLTSLHQLPCVRPRQDEQVLDANTTDTAKQCGKRNKSRQHQAIAHSTNHALLSKLYDCVMETTSGIAGTYNNHSMEEFDPTNTTVANAKKKKADEHKSSSATTKDSTSNDHVRILLVLSAMRWMHAYHHQEQQQQHQQHQQQQQTMDGDTTAANNDTAFDKLQHKILSFLMDNLFGNNHNVDLSIANTVLHIVENNADKKESKQRWISQIQAVVTQCLQQQQQQQEDDIISQELLDVACLLVRLHADHGILPLLLEKAMPPHWESLDQEQLATLWRSAYSRRVFLLAMEQVADHHDNDDDNSMVALEYLIMAPLFLGAWGKDFTYESQVVLQTLLDFIRRMPHLSKEVAVLRTTIESLFGGRSTKESLLEIYSEPLQRLLLGVMVMLQSPTDGMLKSMGAVCARNARSMETNTANERLANLILESIHSVRKSISMGSYMTFLCSTISIPKQMKVNDSDDVKKVMSSMDASLQRVAKLLLSSGPPATRVLEMMQPQLAEWQKSAITARDKSPLEYLLKMRACFVLQAFFFLAMQQQQQQERGAGSMVDSLPSSITLQSLEDSIAGYLHCIVADNAPAVAMKHSSELTSPLVAVMVSVPPLLSSLVHKVSSEWFQSNHLSRTSQCHILQTLLAWLKDSRLWPLLKNNADMAKSLKDSLSTIVSFQCMADNEPAKQLARDSLTQLELSQVLL